jgi:hypothetical protein
MESSGRKVQRTSGIFRDSASEVSDYCADGDLSNKGLSHCGEGVPSEVPAQPVIVVVMSDEGASGSLFPWEQHLFRSKYR